ncbi:MAG: ribbon-helix-helix protein, CopG family [bacterium]|nr:ribbon-helix-helix protein, CopG family [bacterium]
MGHRTVTLDLPDSTYALIEKIAGASRQSVEVVVRELVDLQLEQPVLQEKAGTSLHTLEIYSDVQLSATPR